jgi:hypothetical protein
MANYGNMIARRTITAPPAEPTGGLEKRANAAQLEGYTSMFGTCMSMITLALETLT